MDAFKHPAKWFRELPSERQLALLVAAAVILIVVLSRIPT